MKSARRLDDARALRALVREAIDARAPAVDWDRVERRLESAISTASAKSRVGSHTQHSSARTAWVAACGIAAAASFALLLHVRAPLPRAAGETLTALTAGETERPSALGLPADAPRDAHTLAVGAVITADHAPVSYRADGRATWSLGEGSRVRIVSFGAFAGSDGDQDHAMVIALDEGSVHADVVPQPRPESFVVEVGAVRVAVHGTSFNVRRTADRAYVEVMQGTVAVRPIADTDGTHVELLSPGEQASFPLDGSSDVRWASRLANHLERSLDGTKPKSDGGALSSSAGTTAAPRPSQLKGRSATSGIVLSHIVDGIAACYERQVLSSGADFSVDTSLALTVSAAGSATDAVFDPPLSPTLMACAEQAIDSAKFSLGERGRRLAIPIHLSESSRSAAPPSSR